MPTPSAAGTDLVPVSEGGRISGYDIDVNGLDSTAMGAWLSGLDLTEETALVDTNDADGKDAGAVNVYDAVEGEHPRYLMIKVSGAMEYFEKYVIYAPEAFTFNYRTDQGSVELAIPSGWSYLHGYTDDHDELQIDVTPVTEPTIYRFRNVNVTYVSDQFAQLNGVVVGAIQGEAPVNYTITANVENGTASGDTSIESDGSAEVDIEANEGYEIDPDLIIVTGTDHWEYERGTIYLYYPTGNVTITVTCIAIMRSITPSITNGSATGSTEIQDTIGTASVTIVPGSGFTLPSSVSVSGASYTYNDTTGVVSLSNSTGDVSITATCPALLSPFSVSDVVTGVKFNTQLSTQEVKVICDNYAAETPTTDISINVVEGLTSPIVLLSYATGEWALIVDQTTVWNETSGWQNLDANGEIALASSDTVSQIAIYQAEGVGGNGVVWGKV